MITTHEEVGIWRMARKDWRCTCADVARRNGKRNPNYRSTCLGDIPKGTRYFEYLGEAAAYESGDRYCSSCALAVWDDPDPHPRCPVCRGRCDWADDSYICSACGDEWPLELLHG